MRKQLFAAMALASLVLIGLTATAEKTTATFTATSTNPGNTFASATLTMSNDKPNANDLINVTNLVPGDTAQRAVVISNTGNTYQNLTQDFTITYTATQLAGSAK